MIIQVDLSNPKPVYLQIVESIRRAIATGVLQSGDKLPTIRDAAVQTRVNRNTISKAYQELENLGIVINRQGSGCFVTNSSPALKKQERIKIVQRMVDDLVLECYHHQISTDELIVMIKERASKLNKEPSDE